MKYWLLLPLLLTVSFEGNVCAPMISTDALNACLLVRLRMDNESSNTDMEKIAKVFGKRQFICPAYPFKSEQIAHSLSTYPLLYDAAVPLKSELFHSMAWGDLTFSLLPGYSSIQLFQVFLERMFPMYFCILYLHL